MRGEAGRGESEIGPGLMLAAYRAGIFPMAEARADTRIGWFAPERRGILPLDAFHLPRRLRRTVLSERFEISADRDFRGVIAACAGPRRDADDTWINPAIERSCIALHRTGWAHSIECRLDGALVGGLYGVGIDRAFFGESMFSHATDASKVALVALVAHLRLRGFTLLDTQFLTAHLARFGAVEVGRGRYEKQLAEATEHISHTRFGTLDEGAVRAEIARWRDAPHTPPPIGFPYFGHNENDRGT